MAEAATAARGGSGSARRPARRSGGLPPDPLRGKDWMFDPTSGNMLQLDALRGVACCPQTGYTRSLDELANIEVVSTTDMDEYARTYGLEMLVRSSAAAAADDAGDGATQARARQTVEEPCPQCGHRKLEFYTMQLRSADEGQTVFYECLKCKHKWSVNN